MPGPVRSFDPQALTSLTPAALPVSKAWLMFRSTGSYEPDQGSAGIKVAADGFDPQALTSLTLVGMFAIRFPDGFDPQALTSLTDTNGTLKYNSLLVSIHRLLRA